MHIDSNIFRWTLGTVTTPTENDQMDLQTTPYDTLVMPQEVLKV